MLNNMTLSSSFIALLCLCIFIFTRHVLAKVKFNKKYKLPPQVPGWPIIGNSLDVPFPGGMWGVEMARKYGEMFTVSLGGKTIVHLNSARVVTDLLERRAAIYSSRPFRPMSQDIASGGSRMLLMPYGDRWR
jgi:hypothetical protein